LLREQIGKSNSRRKLNTEEIKHLDKLELIVRCFIEYMQQDYIYSEIRRRLSALRRLNGRLGFEDQTFTEEVYLTIRKLKRSKCIEQRQAAGINEDLLIKMIEAQPETLVGNRNRLLLSLGYDFLARRSELVAIRNEDLTFIRLDFFEPSSIRRSTCRKEIFYI
jgi:site-specific recombinase XerD